MCVCVCVCVCVCDSDLNDALHEVLLGDGVLTVDHLLEHLVRVRVRVRVRVGVMPTARAPAIEGEKEEPQ